MMTPLKLFEYGVAVAGSVGCILLVVGLFVVIWCYLVGSAPKGRNE